ncbi:MAG: hypothetical protein K2N57_01910 [Clostridia bacterium]|nr:hypothetical protein [Clostridia bacterium]
MSQNFNPERKQYSVVLLGDFNPAMFQPEWFSKNDIISPEEVDFARNQSTTCPIIITPQVTLFKTSQFSVRIEQKRFQVVADKEPIIVLKDFILKTFERLSGYVITAFGFNFSAHYHVENNETYHKIGDKLAPKDYWGSLLDDEVSGLDRKSGLSGLEMKKTKKDDFGHISVLLQPSTFVQPGVFMNCNDHFNLPDDDSMAEIVIEKIEQVFDNSFEHMKTLQISVLSEVIKDGE